MKRDCFSLIKGDSLEALIIFISVFMEEATIKVCNLLL